MHYQLTIMCDTLEELQNVHKKLAGEPVEQPNVTDDTLSIWCDNFSRALRSFARSTGMSSRTLNPLISVLRISTFTWQDDQQIPCKPYIEYRECFDHDGRMLTFDEWRELIVSHDDFQNRLLNLRNFGKHGLVELVKCCAAQGK